MDDTFEGSPDFWSLSFVRGPQIWANGAWVYDLNPRCICQTNRAGTQLTWRGWRRTPRASVGAAPHLRPFPLRWSVNMRSIRHAAKFFSPPETDQKSALLSQATQYWGTYWLKLRKTKHNPKLFSRLLMWWPVTPVCPTPHCNSHGAGYPLDHKVASDTYLSPTPLLQPYSRSMLLLKATRVLTDQPGWAVNFEQKLLPIHYRVG